MFTSKREKFFRNNELLKDMSLGHMAQDIEITAKQNVPVSNTKASGNKRGGGGHLQSEIRHFRNASGQFRVEANKQYAAYQERGMRRDGTHVVRHYSTPGTGKNWFRRAIEKVWQNRDNYIKEAARAIGL